jgi:hypothetical protein
VHPRCADRCDRDVDLSLVEVRDRTIEAPARRSDAAGGIPILVRGLPIVDVVVDGGMKVW